MVAVEAKHHKRACCPLCKNVSMYERIVRVNGLLRYCHRCDCGVGFTYEYLTPTDVNPVISVHAECYFCDDKHLVEIHPAILNPQHGTIIPCLKCWEEYECITWWDQMDEAITYPDDLSAYREQPTAVETGPNKA